ncbi:MAG: nucleotidyltransferase [Bacteroidales bacterium]|nr:nucleotidyltransferase [Bacteroidales bacterium]
MNPTLLIMAAGIGSRYGTLKQIDTIGPSGETIIDYSIYDAIKAGFGKVVFIIRKDIEQDFKEIFLNKFADKIHTDFVFQELEDIPSHVKFNPRRIKPWGTGHAIRAAMDKVNEPFVVINADDFYGYGSFEMAASFFSGQKAINNTTYCLIGYRLKNTLSDFGSVSRGVCETGDNNDLKKIIERTHIIQMEKGILYEDENGALMPLDDDTSVSMNMWGFTPSFFEHLTNRFETFLKANVHSLKAEFLIPTVVNDLISEGKVKVKVLESNEKWFGMTYKEDKEIVIKKIHRLIEKNIYPVSLWK